MSDYREGRDSRDAVREGRDRDPSPADDSTEARLRLHMARKPRSSRPVTSENGEYELVSFLFL